MHTTPFDIATVHDFSNLTELSSVALGGKVLAQSDEFFAEAFHLLLVEPAPSLKGQFGPKGALFSGWETRRHNPTYDWCIIRLGSPGLIVGFDIDTSHFNGNEAPQASVEALFLSSDEMPSSEDARWVEILPKVDLGPSARHFFKIPKSEQYSHVKLNMYPDGGIARFRVYGYVAPIFPENLSDVFDLASVFSGGRVVAFSDHHFGVGSNLLLPGRGKDMGDGWETRRSRQKGHKDWVIIRLGDPGFLEQAEIDTAYFMGNFPESAELHALASVDDVPGVGEQEWTQILPRTKLGPHRRHFFQLENVEGVSYTHVRLTIYPDGGVKRVRLLGRRGTVAPSTTPARSRAGSLAERAPSPPRSISPKVIRPSIPAVALTPEGFAPFGHVVQAFSSPHAAPARTLVTNANFGTAWKFHRLAPVTSSYPEGSNAVTALSVYRANPPGAELGDVWEVKILERHPYTNQAFIAMGNGGGIGEDSLKGPPARLYLVVVALNGPDDKPDLETVKAFYATTAQGVVYNTAVWHHPLIALETTIDFACVETQIGGNANRMDCEIVDLKGDGGFPRVRIPAF